jgi:hypothetical protein
MFTLFINGKAMKKSWRSWEVKTLGCIPALVAMGVLLCGPLWESMLLGVATLSAQAPLYNPPKRGAPASRVGGGTRGPGDDRPSIFVLAPDHLGFTTRPQPELYWYLSKDSQSPIKVILNDDTSIEPILETVLPPPIKAGIHRVQLATHKIRLQPEMLYEWYIALAIGTDQPSESVVAGGTITYIGPDDARIQQVNRALQTALNPAETWRLYAASGIWYDAVSALCQRILQMPGQPPQAAELLKQRATLLNEVGLSEIPMDAKQHP